MKEDILIVLKLLYAWLLPPGIFLLATERKKCEKLLTQSGGL